VDDVSEQLLRDLSDVVFSVSCREHVKLSPVSRVNGLGKGIGFIISQDVVGQEVQDKE
jgi:hypothetical protein